MDANGLEETKTHLPFNAVHSVNHLERLRRARQGHSPGAQNLELLYVGIATAPGKGKNQIDIGLACHDGTYSIDFTVLTVGGDGNSSPSDDSLADYFVDRIAKYTQEHLYKFLGAGITSETVKICPSLPSRLWADLDIVPFVFPADSKQARTAAITVDEQADSMARKCLMMFGPNYQPRVVVGYMNQVEVDSSGMSHMASLEQYRKSVSQATWDATTMYAESLKKSNTKIAFFNSTPQGGGVALMRHALVRFFRVIGINCSWYVPKPKPEVFRITKTNHNILQGVAAPEERLSSENKRTLEEWATNNAKRYWTREGGPLAPSSKGGADIIIVDDPQMPNLVTISKEQDPTRPVIFRSHIQVRSDLADDPSTPTAEVWQWLYSNVQHADLFISHPVSAFVPSAVPTPKVGYMPATTDWLDGLNKDLSAYDSAYYLHLFNTECYKQNMTKLVYPSRDYIVQIARFDPAKGIPDVIESYAKLRRNYLKDVPRELTPQLVIAGHGAVDDPDGTRILDETLRALDSPDLAELKPDVVVMRLGPTDQLLNALISNAKIALQLSTREGFEVKVSEALHKGIPTIATNAGGIPLQVVHGKSGYVVDVGDTDAVATYLNLLWRDEEVYRKMSEYAAQHVSDEVGTVGNALAWMYLADALTKGKEEGGKKLELNGRWVNEMAREGAGLPYQEGEDRLPRDRTT
ncbi:glycosyltransferase family 4 protein [Aulographum hederae CBS 113979]|uniref:Glycosyltransferase family 4 protein n=1 Tax=Aulographum hederae CBS 113979 TaxID=1176131 RepID=A0A6G1GRK8_9PEZI|nr:glycosyltransferase family 4 protein [Aulographum hederae CBS 113979]